MVMLKIGKRGLTIGLLALLLVVFGTGYVWFGKENKQAGTLLAVATPTNPLADKDSDADGLKDWEEALWGTDAHSKDTDGDGTSDGAEVAARRDPAKKGPDDKLPEAIPAQGDGVATKAYAYEYDPRLGKTPTEQLALNLTSNYLLTSAGQSLTDPQKASLVNNLVADITKTLPAPKVFPLGSLKVGPTNYDTMLDYFNALGAIMQNASPGGVDEAVIMQSAMTSNKLTDLVMLGKIGEKFSKAATLAMRLTVPDKLAAHHLAFANELTKAGWGLETMGNKSNDPTIALLGLNAYRSAYDELTTNVAPALLAPITKGEVSISPGDSASFFTQTQSQ